MSEPVDRIDHVVNYLGDRLDQAVAGYEALGFKLTPRGHHSVGSSNHLAIFGTDYLELLGYEPQKAHLAAGQWGSVTGLRGLVFKTDDAQVLADSLHARGIATQTHGPQPLSRPVDLPDGTVAEASFRTLHLDPATTPEGRVYFCEHQTPDLVWTPQWQDQPNGVTGINAVVIVADDPVRAIATVQGLYLDHPAQPVPGGLRIGLRGGAVEYLTPDAAKARYGAALPPLSGASAQQVALVLKVGAITRTAEVLARGGSPFTRTDQGDLIVPAKAAFGVTLVFTEADPG